MLIDNSRTNFGSINKARPGSKQYYINEIRNEIKFEFAETANKYKRNIFSEEDYKIYMRIRMTNMKITNYTKMTKEEVINLYLELKDLIDRAVAAA
jgi:hypothetical protein